MTTRAWLAVIALMLVAFVAACHDEIPVAGDRADSVVVVESDSKRSWNSSDRQPSEELSWGVSEQHSKRGIDLRYLHVSYSINNAGGLAWEGVHLDLYCFDGTARGLSL